MNANKLKAIIILHGEDCQKLAAVLGLSRNSLYMRLNGKTSFRLKEIRDIANHYQLEPDQIDDIFFTR